MLVTQYRNGLSKMLYATSIDLSSSYNEGRLRECKIESPAEGIQEVLGARFVAINAKQPPLPELFDSGAIDLGNPNRAEKE